MYENAQIMILDIVSLCTWVLYIIVALGLSLHAPNYLDTLKEYTKLYISLFLILRFNPFYHPWFKNTFTLLDQRIVFNAGIFLLTTTFVNNWIDSYVNNSKSFFKKYAGI
jgi:hypothetical protein